MSHTPGKWLATPHNTAVMAFTSPTVGEHVCMAPSNPDDIPLICAAPDLLNALEEALALLETHEPVWYTRGLYNRMTAAIRKARGIGKWNMAIEQEEATP